MGTTLTGKKIKDTYKSLIKVTDNTEAGSNAKQLSDGDGNDFGLFIDTDGVVGIGAGAVYSLDVSSKNDGIALPTGTTANRPTGSAGLIRYNSTLSKLEYFDTGFKQIASETYVNTQVSNLIDSAPGALDTLNEIAAALNDDANFSTTITNLINTKQDTITGAATTITGTDLTASKAVISNSSGKVAVSATTDTELGYVSGVTSSIQTQINAKQDTISAGTGIDITGTTVSADLSGLVDTGALQSDAVTAPKIAQFDDNLSAAVAGTVLISNGTDFTDVALSGDITVSSAGVTTLTQDKQNVKNPHSATAQTFTTTVATKTSAHRYNGSGSSLGYVIDGVQAPYITLTPGNTYKFDQSDSSNSGHPLAFYYESDKTTSYTSGVTTSGTPGSSGAYTQIIATDSTPTVLFYQCTSHGLMGNTVNFDTRNLTGFDTDDLSEGSSNLYFSDERAQDAAASMITGGSHTNLTATYDDSSNTIDLAVTGISGSGGGATTINVENFDGDNSTTAFVLSNTIANENNLQVYIDGVYQSKSNYSTSGTTLTFSTAPATGTANIEVTHAVAIGGTPSIEVDTFNGDGSDTTFTLTTEPANKNNLQIYIDGIYQAKSNYSTSGTTLTFTTAPLTGTNNIEVTHIKLS